MTQPDGYDPGNFAPLSVTSQKTQEDWENEIRADLAPAFNPLEVAASWIINSIQGLIDTIIEALTRLPVVGGALEDVFEALDGLWNTAQSALDGVSQLAWNLLNDPVGTLGQIPMMLVDGLESTIDGILDALQQVPVIGDIVRVLRQLGSQLFPLIPLTSVGDVQPNLLAEPGFDTADTVSGGGFYWDGSDGRTKNGCAAVDCDGEDHVIISNLIPVAKDQVLEVGGHVSYAGVDGVDSIKIELATYLGDSPVSTEPIGAITPSGNSTDWSASISGEFTVPDGVDYVAQQLRVTSDATAGVVRFDDCWVRKKQPLKMSFVDGLVAQVNVFTNNIQGIIDSIFNAFNNLGEWLDELNPLGTVVDAILGLLGIGTGAQTGVTELRARIRALESAANTIVLDFNGASSSNPGPGFVVQSTGGGGGNMGLDGRGALVWKPSGFGNRTQIARYTTSALDTDNCRLEWILASTPQSYLFDDAYTYLCARMNEFTDYVRVRSGYDSVRVQAVVGGSVINVGPAWNGHPKAGDAFEWQIGDEGGANERHHVLRRNGVVILDFTETTSVVGPKHVGVGMETGNRLVLFQNIPAGLAVLTAAEVL